MTRLCLNKSLSLSACLAPVFYFTIALAVLRLCLLVKALFYVFTNIFKCCSGSSLKGKVLTEIEFKVFIIDFFFAANEPLLFVALLMTLLYLGAIDISDKNSAESNSKFNQRGF